MVKSAILQFNALDKKSLREFDERARSVSAFLLRIINNNRLNDGRFSRNIIYSKCDVILGRKEKNGKRVHVSVYL